MSLINLLQVLLPRGSSAPRAQDAGFHRSYGSKYFIASLRRESRKPVYCQVVEISTICRDRACFAFWGRIRVIVEALINPDWDEATNAYYNMLLPVLDKIEFPDD